MAQGRYHRVIAVRNSYSITAYLLQVIVNMRVIRILKTWASHPPLPGKEDNQNEIMFLYANKLRYFYDHISPIYIYIYIYDGWKTIVTLS